MSWARHPAHPQQAHNVFWRSDIEEKIHSLSRNNKTTLPYGNGRSYGDSCLATGNRILRLRPLNRILSADWQTGVIRAEAGMTIGELLDIIIPQKWFVGVTPGTRFVTLGGAVANDVHGKNHHRQGGFGTTVRAFGLIRSDSPPARCSKTENADLFHATIGGLGLTGIIDWVELQLMPVTSPDIIQKNISFTTLAGGIKTLQDLSEEYTYTVGWIDCTQNSLKGRGIIFAGNHADNASPLPSKERSLSIPFTPPVSLVNTWSIKRLNSLYYRMHRKEKKHLRPCRDFFYPLDNISNWNRACGPKGFQQYQCVIPDNAAQQALHELLAILGNSNHKPFLASLKKFGDTPSPGWLSFPLPGLSLALDFINHPALESELFARMDNVVRQAKGRLYPAKDAHMSAEDFRNYYPDWKKLAMLKDPALCSYFWNRVTQE